MMIELDWATNNRAVGTEEIALDEYLSEEIFEAGLEADNREIGITGKACWQGFKAI